MLITYFREAAPIVKGFADLNDHEWHEAIGGAIFVFGCIIIFVYEVWRIIAASE